MKSQRQSGENWRPRRDSNPCYRRERAMSWASGRRGRMRSLPPQALYLVYRSEAQIQSHDVAQLGTVLSQGQEAAYAGTNIATRLCELQKDEDVRHACDVVGYYAS